ncbi:alpha/beta hydrolase fold protein [Psychromonas ingrahamii 37]|uniref:Alpha/beta hydrolase fold protein n=1 Tax=Psychromonas ingrahamii (strain DSM 17664 / CCUG 51855 / 37) TaxID=357804 RepID=A1STA4_PSYIN|nr:alpha/beta fold hydrolase [Psychromonas ingrahamii]ABM02719.1 alpha/beta hydrolase fold protein [Psychromonas ingrahamii 37]
MLLNYQQKKSTLPESKQPAENIFIIHGLFGSLSNLSGLASELQELYHTISVDLRNHGNSPHDNSMTYIEMANDIFSLADHLNIEHFSIVGHSMGGKVAMACALLNPQRVNKIIVADIAPVVYTDKHNDVFIGLNALANEPIQTRKTAELTLSPYITIPETRQFLLKSLRKKGENFHLLFNLPALSANYATIRSWPEFDDIFNKEALFIKGADSDYILPEYQANILHYFPNAKAKMIKDTGHWLHAEKPKTFNRLVKEFLK